MLPPTKGFETRTSGFQRRDRSFSLQPGMTAMSQPMQRRRLIVGITFCRITLAERKHGRLRATRFFRIRQFLRKWQPVPARFL